MSCHENKETQENKHSILNNENTVVGHLILYLYFNIYEFKFFYEFKSF